MAQPGHSRLLAIIMIAAAFALSAQTARIIKRKARGTKRELYWRYMGSILQAAAGTASVILIGMQFTATAQASTELLKSTGLAVAVVGFAAQEVLRDVIAGFTIAVSRPYGIGDRISITSLDLTGLVEDITLRHTVIKCFDNSRVIVPNSVINRDVLKSTDYADSVAGNFLEIGISYDSDIGEACRILKSVILGHPLVVDASKGISDRERTVLVKELSDSAVVLKTTVWTKTVDDNFAACSDIRAEAVEAFGKAGITIPYRCVTVYDGHREDAGRSGRKRRTAKKKQ